MMLTTQKLTATKHMLKCMASCVRMCTILNSTQFAEVADRQPPGSLKVGRLHKGIKQCN